MGTPSVGGGSIDDDAVSEGGGGLMDKPVQIKGCNKGNECIKQRVKLKDGLFLCYVMLSYDCFGVNAPVPIPRIEGVSGS